MVNHESAVSPAIAVTVATRTAADQPASRRKWSLWKGPLCADPLGAAVAFWGTGYLVETLGVRLRVAETRTGDKHPERGNRALVVLR
jgi:hypothetical protein